MDSLQLSADLGALDVLHHLAGPRVQVCDVILELVHRGVPPGLPVVLKDAPSMAGWARQKENVSD